MLHNKLTLSMKCIIDNYLHIYIAMNIYYSWHILISKGQFLCLYFRSIPLFLCSGWELFLKWCLMEQWLSWEFWANQSSYSMWEPEDMVFLRHHSAGCGGFSDAQGAVGFQDKYGLATCKVYAFTLYYLFIHSSLILSMVSKFYIQSKDIPFTEIPSSYNRVNNNGVWG